MYHRVVKTNLRKTFAAVSRGDGKTVMRAFAPDAALFFAGDHALGGTFQGRAAIGAWFERLFTTFPDLQLEPEKIVVEGFPWDTSVATRFTVTATLPTGGAYMNEGMQLLRIRWGRVVEERLYEDTQALSRALGTIAATGAPGPSAPIE
jgi:ketosteroid isomerase-like protein